MKKSFMAKFKLFFTIILALTMAFSLLSSVACKGKKDNDDSSSSSSSTTTITEVSDTKTLKNGDFEFGTANTAVNSFPVSSGINWSRSNFSLYGESAPTSSYSSGIIDTREFKYEYDEDGYVKLDEDGKPVHLLDEDGEKIDLYNAIAKNKGDQFIKIYEYEGEEIKKDENGNEIFTYYNPRTPSYYGLTEYTEDDGLIGGGKILMINNRNSTEEKLGTAQSFSYSGGGLTLLPGENAKIELWLMTKDLKTAMDEDFTDFGAWIEIDTTLGSIATPATRIKNIDTNGQWTKFSFFVEGSNYAQVTLSIKVGLGMGNKNIKQQFVEGYTFVDDVTFTKLDKEDTLPTTADFTSNLYTGTTLNKGDDGQTDSYFDKNFKADYLATNTITANPTTGSEYAYLAENFAVSTSYSNVVTTISCQKEEVAITPASLSSGAVVEELDNYTGSVGVNETDSYSTTWSTFTALALDNPFEKDDILEIKYTKEANISYETSTFSIDENQNLMISFWVKTKLNPAVSGLSIYLIDKGTNSGEKPVETALKENLITHEGDNEDYDDWTKLTVIVSNNYKAEEGDTVPTRFFSLKMILGPTSTTDSIHAFSKGSAYLANVSAMFLTKNDDIDEVASVEKTSNSVTQRVLQADLANTTTKTEKTDSYTFTSGGMVDNIKNSVVNGINKYSGVIGNHNRVGGTKTAISQQGTIAGLFNSEYFDNYSSETFGTYASQIKTWMDSVDTTNEYIQPLMIHNSVEGISYGYIGESTSISANTTATISIKVKVFGDSTAYIYLSDANDKKDFSILGVRAEHKNLGDNIDQVVNGDYLLALTAKDIDTVTGGNGYATVTFIIKTGNQGINFRLEMWNGSRLFDSASSVNTDRKVGIVLFDEYSFTTGTNLDTQLIKLKSRYDSSLANVKGTDYDYSFQTADENKQIFTRLPATVKTDENPDGETRYYQVSDKDNTKTAYISNKFFTISDLSSIDISNEIDERTTEDTSDDDTSSDTSSSSETTAYSPFLYFTSLAVSFVLIAALVAIVVKNILSSIKKKKAKNQSYYDKDLRATAVENIKAKKETKFKEEYDYDNIESNLIEEETTETTETEQETEVEEITETEETAQVEEETTETTETQEVEEVKTDSEENN